MERERTTETRREFERVLERHLEGGWRVVRLDAYEAVLRRRTPFRRHLLAFVLVGWWTFGAGSVAYALWARWRAERLRVRLVVADGGWRSGDVTPAPRPWARVHG